MTKLNSIMCTKALLISCYKLCAVRNNISKEENQMNIFQIKLLTFLAIGFLLSMPAVAMNLGAKPAGESAYSCDLSPAEIMTAAVSQTMEDDPGAEMSFEFHATVVKDNKMLVKSIDGLPGVKSQDNGSLTATIMMPILVSEFTKNDILILKPSSHMCRNC